MNESDQTSSAPLNESRALSDDDSDSVERVSVKVVAHVAWVSSSVWTCTPLELVALRMHSVQ